MTLQIPPGFTAAVYHWTVAGVDRHSLSTMAFDNDSFTGAEVDWPGLLYADFVNAFATGTIIDSWTFQGVVIHVGQDGSDPLTFESFEPYEGTNSSDPLPPNCATLVRKITAIGGRRGRGRMFLPPFHWDEDSVDERGVINSTALGDFAVQIAAWFEDRIPVLLHDDAITPIPDPTPITALVPQAKLATQRRRLR